MRVMLLGPPGVGKGTQGRRLADGHGLALISTGEILREAVARASALGRQAQQRMDAGLLVPDDVMVALVRERLEAPDTAAGFVLDGFPRTLPQAEALDRMLDAGGCPLDGVVSLDAPEAEIVERLGARRECPVCQRAYNLLTARPRDGVHCDAHPQAELRHRADDAPETVRRRLEVYHRETAPLLDHYRRQGKLREVAGTGAPTAVYQALERALGLEVAGA